MIGVYKIATGWRVFVYITCIALVAGFTYALTLPFIKDPIDMGLAYILTPISIAMIALGLFGFAEALKSKLTITNDSITLRGGFRTRTLSFESIRGYRLNENSIILFPEQGNHKKIEITRYTSLYQWIEDWITSNFVDLDEVQGLFEHHQILQNDEFGTSYEQRANKLAEAKKVTIAFNIVGTIIGGWVFFYPTPYSLCVILGMTVPVIGMILIYISRGIITLNEKKNSAHPSVIYGVIFSLCGLMLRAILDYDLIFDENIWITSASCTVCFVMLLHYGSRELKFKKAEDILVSLTLVPMFFGFSFAAYAIANCQFDQSSPQVFESSVVEKSTSSGSMTTYYLTLTPWGPVKETDRVSVAEDLYNTIQKNEHVNVFLKKGLLDTQWFYIKKGSN